MPVIVAPGFAALRSRYTYLQGRDLALGVKGAADAISSGILDWEQRKETKDKEDIALLSNIIKTYGSQVGQGPLEHLDSLLQKRNLGGLPRDPSSGHLMAPPETLDEKINKTIGEDPDLLHSLVIKKATGLSPVEQRMSQEKLNASIMHTKAIDVYRTVNAQAAYIQAEANKVRANAVKNTDAFSGFVSMPDGAVKSLAEVQTEDGTLPPGARPLSNTSAKIAVDVMKVRNDADVKKAQTDLAAAKFDFHKKELQHYLSYGKGAAGLELLNTFTNPKTTTDMQDRIAPVLRPMIKDALPDASDAEIDQFLGIRTKSGWLPGWLTDTFRRNKPTIDAIILDRAMLESEGKFKAPPAAPGEMKLKDGTVMRKYPETELPDE